MSQWETLQRQTFSEGKGETYGTERDHFISLAAEPRTEQQVRLCARHFTSKVCAIWTMSSDKIVFDFKQLHC